MSPFLTILILTVAMTLSRVPDGTTEYSSEKIHECVHDKLNKTNKIQRVNYFKHPFDRVKNGRKNHLFQDSVDRRKLIEDANYQSIRISPYYDPSTVSTSNGLTTSQVTYIKQLISAAINYFQSFIKIIRVHGPLFIDACPITFKSNDNSFIYPRCAQNEIDQSCGNVLIPDDHLLETWVYDESTFKSTKYKSAGSGMTNLNETEIIIVDRLYAS